MRTAAPCCVVITLQATSKSQEEVRSLGCGAPRLFGYFSLSLSLSPLSFLRCHEGSCENKNVY